MLTWFDLATCFNTLFIAGFIAGRLWVTWRAHRSIDYGCPHCWHWLYTTRMGTVMHQHCCRCGHLRATHVVGDTEVSTLRVGDHGKYIEFQSERDFSTPKKTG